MLGRIHKVPRPPHLMVLGNTIGSLHKRAMARSTYPDTIAKLTEEAKDGRFLCQDLPNKAVCRNASASKTVTLLHPLGSCSAFTRSGSLYPPLGLNQLAAVINDSSRVHVSEADGNFWSNEETIERLRQDTPLALGMTVTCGTRSVVSAWSTVVKYLHPTWQPTVIFGGPAAAFETPTIFDQCPHVDVTVKGEGEAVFPRIVTMLEEYCDSHELTLEALSSLPGVAVRKYPAMNDSKINIVPKQAFESLAFPDLSNSPIANYRAPDAKRSPMITMMTQR